MRSFSAALIRPSRRKGRPPDLMTSDGIASSSKVLVADQRDRIRSYAARRALLHHDSIGQPNIQFQRNRTIHPTQSSPSSSSGIIRYMHASKSISKPPNSFSTNDRIYSMEAAIPNSGHVQPYFPDPADILTEWRLLERKIRDTERKGKAKEIDLDELVTIQPAMPNNQTFDPEFFSPFSKLMGNAHIISITDTVQEVPPLKIIPEPASPNISHPQLWTTTLDEKMINKILKDMIAEIRTGSHDVHTLAINLLNSLKTGNEEKDDLQLRSNKLRLEELRMLILSFWITITSPKIGEMSSEKVSAYISVTKSMYQSSLAVAVSAKDEYYSPSIMAIQRSTLYRMFGNLIDLTNTRMDVKPTARSEALGVCTDLACDPRLRPSQVRYMTRKVLGRLASSVEKKTEVIREEEVWDKVKRMLYNLMERGIIQPPQRNEVVQKSGQYKEMYNPISNFLLSCNRAIQSGMAPFALAQHTSLALAKRVSEMRKGDKLEKGSFTFVKSVRQLEMMVANLLKGREVRAAYQIYLRAPDELHSFEIVCRLLRYYGDAPLQLTSKLHHEQISCRKGSAASRLLMKKALEDIEKSSEMEQNQKLRDLAYARFAYWADNGKPGRAMNELRDFVRLFGNGKKNERIQFLVKFGQPVYCQFIRALARGGRWFTSKELSLKIVEHERQLTSDKTVVANQGVKLLNVLLRAYLWPLNKSQSFGKYRPLQYHRFSNANSSLSIAANEVRISRWKRTKNGMTFLEQFCQTTGVVPDETTTVLLLNSLRQCNRQIVSDEAISKLETDFDWNWKENGVREVNEAVKSLIMAVER